MSSPNYKIKLAKKAQSDIVKILNYTLANWGDIQTETYKKVLDKGLETIAANPLIGNGNIPPYFYWQAGKHYIFYRLESNNITVVRVLHTKMDLAKYLQ